MRRVGWSWTGSVAVDMAECRLDFETMHHGQRSGARPDHPITGSRIIHLVVRSEYKSGNAQELEQWAAVITRRAAAWGSVGSVIAWKAPAYGPSQPRY